MMTKDKNGTIVFSGTLQKGVATVGFVIYADKAVVSRSDNGHYEMMELSIEDARLLWKTYSGWGYEQAVGVGE